MSEYIERTEAEDMIYEAVEDYLSEGTLQQILDVIFGEDEYIVVNKESEEEENEDE